MTLPATIGVWLALILLIGAEYVVRGVLALAIGAAMAAIVALTYMRLVRQRDVSAAFALAAVFWLLVLLGLGSLDPATRRDVSVPVHGGE
jgi:dolichol kinase